ncbi:MAG: ABC transporter ATP-binding protein [Chloroflexi bacterium]|nr:ABC transporter ATP-binding protein [Chloroflexota bacterium]
MSRPIKLRARGVRKVFHLEQGPLVALDGISLDVAANEFVTIVGTSGCGKSTFLHLVAGLIPLTDGIIEVDGRRIDGPGADRGMVFQSYTLFPWLKVLDNVKFSLRRRGLSRAEQEEIAREHLRLVGLEDFADVYPNQLSGGMQQRVAIARALAYNPSILLMDEPFGALDAQTRGLMQELLLQVWEQSKTTILFVTHDIDEAIFLADRVYVMTNRPGRIKREIDVPLPRPRSYAIEMSPEFMQIKREVVELIREESMKSIAPVERL